MTASEAVEGVQLHCNILGRATAAFICICYILGYMCEHMSLSTYATFEQLLLQLTERCINRHRRYFAVRFCHVRNKQL